MARVLEVMPVMVRGCKKRGMECSLYSAHTTPDSRLLLRVKASAPGLTEVPLDSWDIC